MIGFRVGVFLKGHGRIVNGPVLISSVIKCPGNSNGPDGIQAVGILNNLKFHAVNAILWEAPFIAYVLDDLPDVIGPIWFKFICDQKIVGQSTAFFVITPVELSI